MTKFNRMINFFMESNSLDSNIKNIIKSELKNIKKTANTKNLNTLRLIVYNRSIKKIMEIYKIDQTTAEKWVSKFF